MVTTPTVVLSAPSEAASAALASLLSHTVLGATTLRQLQRALEHDLGTAVPRDWLRLAVDEALQRGAASSSPALRSAKRRRAAAAPSHPVSAPSSHVALSKLRRMYDQHAAIRQRLGRSAVVGRSVLHAVHDCLCALPHRRGSLSKVVRALQQRYGSIAAALPVPLDGAVRQVLESAPSWFQPVPPKAEGKPPRFMAVALPVCD